MDGSHLITLKATPAGVAFFDFDDTLIEGDSLPLFLAEIAGRGRVAAAFAAAALAALGRADFKTSVKRQVLRCLLAGVPADDCLAAGERVAEKLRWNDWMCTIAEQQRDAGWAVVVATGALDVYLPALLPALGPVDAVIATQMEIVDGQLTGEMLGGNCVRREKARRVAALMAALPPSVPSVAYGNRPSDLPMMAAVERGVIVRLRHGQLQPVLTDYAGG